MWGKSPWEQVTCSPIVHSVLRETELDKEPKHVSSGHQGGDFAWTSCLQWPRGGSSFRRPSSSRKTSVLSFLHLTVLLTRTGWCWRQRLLSGPQLTGRPREKTRLLHIITHQPAPGRRPLTWTPCVS